MTRAGFAPIDTALVLAFLAATLIAGFWRRRYSDEAYMIAERSLSLPVFVATLVATFYGGILAVGEFTYGYGLVTWTTQGLPYYLFAILFALLLAPRVRRAALYTVPDKLALDYGRLSGILGGLLTFVLASPAPYILMAGQLAAVALGLPLLPAILLATIVSVVYVFVGGFLADVRVNVFQFCLMFAGFAVALPVVISQTGGLDWMASRVPPDHLKWDGGMGAGYVAVWFFIALWTFVDPGFHQRCYAARNQRIARNGMLVAVGCWLVFDAMTTTTGLYARAAMPNLPPSQHGMAFPLLAERLLPPGVKGLFYVGMMATVMSSVVSYTFLSATAIGRDVLWRLAAEPEARAPLFTRWGLAVSTLVAVLIAWWVPSVVKQWYLLGTVVVPGLLLPVLSGYVPGCKASPRVVPAAMVLGAGTSTAWMLAGWLPHGPHMDTTLFPLGIQPMYAGITASALVFALGWPLRPRVPLKGP